MSYIYKQTDGVNGLSHCQSSVQMSFEVKPWLNNNNNNNSNNKVIISIALFTNRPGALTRTGDVCSTK